MDEKVKKGDRQVLLAVVDAEDGQGKTLKAVTGLDDKGKLKTVSPDKNNQSSFLEIDTNRNLLENFFKKFLEQSKNPAHTGFYLVAQKVLDKILKSLPIRPEQLEPYRVEPKQFLVERQQAALEKTPSPEQKPVVSGEQKPVFEPFDESRINRRGLEPLGVKWEDIEPELKAMLYGHKSPHLIPMKPVVEGIEIPTQGRLSLVECPDGHLRFDVHYAQSKLDLDSPVHGVLLTPDDREQLLKTGNAGRVIELEPIPGRKVPSFVSVDKLTNRLDALPVKDVNINESLKGVELSPQQRNELYEGKKVLVEGMTSRSNFQFDAYLQINASSKSLDFTYEGLDRNRYRQDNKQERGADPKGIVIPHKLAGVDLSQKQHDELRSGSAVYIKGMVIQGKEPQNLYVKVNYQKEKLDFFRWNPDKAKKQEQAKPAESQIKKPLVKKPAGIKI
ncbi:hypothetical protein FACS1894123_05060 [Bacteroidia bacterium]|nr:hypothetical protein FACS1894123_05060 [Bacteroidia bacterium]